VFAGQADTAEKENKTKMMAGIMTAFEKI